MISLRQGRRRGDYLKNEEPLVIGEDITKKLVDWNEKLKITCRRAMEESAKNPRVYD